MSDISKFKRLRAGSKAVCTKQMQTSEVILQTKDEVQITCLLKKLVGSLKKIRDYDEKIIDLISEEEVETELMQQSDYEEKVEDEIVKIELALNKLKQRTDKATRSKEIKLPTLSLTTFDGDPKAWTGFWELFKCAVDDREDLTDIQKFTYLKGQLQDDALMLISGFSMEAASYESAKDLLKGTYGQEEQIKAAHISAFYNLVAPAYNVKELKRFHAASECALKAIKTSNITLHEFCVVLLSQKLPAPMKENIRRELKQNWLDLDSFTAAFLKEIQTLEANDSAFRYSHEPDATAAFAVSQSGVGRGEKLPQTSTHPKTCRLCDRSGHFWAKCRRYRTGCERIARAKALNLCTNCLSKEHDSNGCNNDKLGPCKFCQKKHYFGLCPKHGKQSQTLRNRETKDTSTTLTAIASTGTSLLPTAQIPLVTSNNKTRVVRALLDQCSQRSFVLRSYLDELDHKVIGQVNLKLQGFTSVTERKEYDVVALTFRHKLRKRTLCAVVVDQIPHYKSPVGLADTCKRLVKKGYKLTDPNLNSNNEGEIGLLIGADHYYDIVHAGYIRDEGVVLLPTIYGYALSGRFQSSEEGAKVEVITVLKVATHPVESQISKEDGILQSPPEIKDLNALWELDHVGIIPEAMSNDARKVLNSFEESLTYSSEENQYTVKLPWNDKKHLLPTNFKLALGRLKGLQRKFAKDPEYCNQYSKVIAEQEQRGFIERIESNEVSNSVCHYLPHKGVKKDSVTTPVRVVYDCSARDSLHGLSLNDCLHTGPTLVTELTEVLLRFRLHKYAWISDIEKAYLMVKLAEEDQDSTRFLWPLEPNNPDSDYITYRFKVVLFGATCSQFLLNATIRRHLHNTRENEEVIKRLQRGLYIDNLQGTGDTATDLRHQFEVAVRTFSKAHLYLREWVSNCASLQTEFSIKNVAAASQEKVKTLGVYWSTERDQLSIQHNVQSYVVSTKREALHVTASVFDPLGLILPVTIRARLFIQQLWKMKSGWDEKIPEEMSKEWLKIARDVQGSLQVAIPRQVCVGKTAHLHVFSDASTKAYGAAAYFCNNDGSSLIMAKAKVAPIRSLTVPKLELTAVVMAARLTRFIIEAYKDELTIVEVHLWCDSQIALAWLTSNKALIAYVQNRVDEIKGLVPEAAIHYVPTADNPSDLITRGISATCLTQSMLWWRGPGWLPHKKSWPDLPGNLEACEGQEVVSVNITPDESKKEPSLLFDWKRFSSYGKLTRVMAWIVRFIGKCKRVSSNSTSYLNVQELRIAEIKVISLVQKEAYSQEYDWLSNKYKKKPTPLMYRLGLYKEGDLIKCKGRLQRASVSEQIKNPIILPTKHEVTRLLVEAAHKTCQHYGVGYVVAYIRHKYWIPRLRQVVKGVQYRCIICKRLQGKRYAEVPEPPLPDIRVQQVAPFQVTGVDYTGAISVKREGAEIGKVYVLLFTCAVTRAVHLEIVTNLTCDSFLHAFRRFSSRRGFPQILLSDNATTFQSGSKILIDLLKNSKVINDLAERNCEWRFIPARAPWYGAIWERCIGIIKAGMKKVLGRALVTEEELTTVLLELEAAVNDRPLGYTSGELDEPLPITPSQLTHGRRLRSFPRYQVEPEDLNDPTLYGPTQVSRRAQYVNKLSNDVWRRWAHEYLLSLRESNNKARSPSGGTWPAVGDVVLIHDEGPRLLWRLGRITKLMRGQDQYCRVVELRTEKGVTTRSIKNLYPMEIDLDLGHKEERGDIRSGPPERERISGAGDVVNSRPARQSALQSSRLLRSLIHQGGV